MKGVIATAFGASAVMGEQRTAYARQPEALTSEEQSHIELIQPAVIEPLDPALSQRPQSPIQSFGFNTEELNDANDRLTLTSFNFFNMMYTNEAFFNDNHIDNLIQGVMPSEEVSQDFLDNLKNNPDMTISFNGAEGEEQLDPKQGLSLSMLKEPGVFHINGEYISFTPWVDDEKKFHMGLYISDQVLQAETPDPDRFASGFYNVVFCNAVEFMALTKGSQELWDAYCVQPDSPYTAFRAQNATALFDSINPLLLGPKNSEGTGWEGPLTLSVELAK